MMPDVSAAVRNFEETLQFTIVTKTVEDHDLVEGSLTPKQVPLWFEGSLIPMHPRELLVKPEGLRKFKWWTLFTDLDIKVDTIVKDQQGSIFRVMNSSDWRDGGYRSYEIIEGPGL